jgi:hypothetical protein
MRDLLYVVGSVVFFALMIAYVAACARIGRAQAAEESSHDD